MHEDVLKKLDGDGATMENANKQINKNFKNR